MPRKPLSYLDERLIGHLANSPSEVGVDELLRLFKGQVSRRTLQRRLSALIRVGRLISKGAGPSTIYLLPKPAELQENYVIHWFVSRTARHLPSTFSSTTVAPE